MQMKKDWRSSTPVVVFCCVMMVLTSLGFCSSPKSFYLDEVTKEMGVSRSAFALNDTFRYVVTATMSLFFAGMVKKLGTKKLIILGFALMIASQVTFALAPNVMVFWVGGALMGGGLTLVSSTMVSYVITRRVKKNTGTVLGFALAANGIGGAISIPLISYCIENTEGGYHTAYFLVAGILAVVGILVGLLFQEDDTIPHTGPAQKKARGNAWEGIRFEEGKKLPVFYVVCVLTFSIAICLAAINGISKAHCRDVGFSNEVLAGIWSCHSLALMGGKFLFGLIYDKKGLRWALMIAQSACVLVLSALALAATTPLGTAMVWFYSIFSAMALPLETVGVSLVVGDLFGRRDYGKFLGVMTAVSSAGFALGSPCINLIYDLMGSYRPGIWGAVVLMAVAAVAFQLVVKTAYRQRENVMCADSGA